MESKVSIEKELAKRRHQAAAKGIQLRHRAAQKEAHRVMNANKAPVTPANGVSNEFAELLKRKAAEVKAKQENDVRADLPEVLAKLRKEGKLALPNGQEVAYVPTPEQVLGPELTKNLVAEPHKTETLPSPEEVLNGSHVQALAPAEPLRHTAFRSTKKR
jgi:hypothetical protein